jgi:EAL domain-containing protein (putative c-di-GMP-specific phosphodiesterase class I)
MVFQPIYCLDTGDIVGAEALARFSDSGSRGPDAWFAEAAQVGLGTDLELAAVHSALRALPHLPGDLYLAVNVSPETVVSEKLARLLADVPPGRLVLEITEHAIIQDFVLLREALQPLRERVLIAVDDAGAGYAGLHHILNIAPDIIKLDMVLTRGIDSDPARRALAAALIGFAVNTNSRIVAEGVETQAELTALRQLGTDAAQGYFLQRPQPLHALTRFLIARSLTTKGLDVGRSPAASETIVGGRASGEGAAIPKRLVSWG